eukprot:COSAG01_NODE_1524_length_10019_cov_6.258367_15_plen_90_part_00
MGVSERAASRIVIWYYMSSRAGLWVGTCYCRCGDSTYVEVDTVPSGSDSAWDMQPRVYADPQVLWFGWVVLHEAGGDALRRYGQLRGKG